MSTAANLANLLSITNDINYYTQLQIYYANKQEANEKKLTAQTKAETKWENAYDSAMNNTSEKKCGSIVVAKDNENEALAEAYANAKVSEYDEELKEELASLDIEYDTLKAVFETELENLRAQEEGAKQNTSTAAQNTHLIS